VQYASNLITSSLAFCKLLIHMMCNKLFLSPSLLFMCILFPCFIPFFFPSHLYTLLSVFDALIVFSTKH
jgi:hypothetical protein